MDGYGRLGKREIYRNPFVTVEVYDVVHPTGARGEHVLVVTPQASAALIVDGGDFLFTRQPRFAARGEAIEVVKGGREPGESALECAQREAREELGIVAARWESLGLLHEIPSIVEPPVELFMARGVEHVDVPGEPLETVSLVRVPEAAAYAAAAAGGIDDALTLAALLRYGIRTGRLRL